MKKIKLTKGYHALVDNSDYQRVILAGPWHASVDKHTVYAKHSFVKPNGDRGCIVLHRFILGITTKTRVDHKDRNGLNCQKKNLRVATEQQSQRNRRGWKKSSSKYKGVSWHKKQQTWTARITVNRKTVALGYFGSEKAAAKAYDAAARNYFGKFAFTNFKEKNER